MFISVIVPVYNADRTLRRCVDSILAQNHSEFECLLIDDGSTDGSGDICDHYADLDARVRVIHRANGGISSVRNLGIREAKAEYITFIDSDDYVGHSFLANFHIGKETDLIIQDIANFKNRIVQKYGISEQNLFLGGSRQISLFIANLIHLNPIGGCLRMCHGKLYRKSLIDSCQFDKDMVPIEDYIFNLRIFGLCSSMVVVPFSDGYYYVQDNSVLTKSYYTIAQRLNSSRVLAEELDHLSMIWSDKTIYNNVLRNRNRWLYYNLMYDACARFDELCKVWNYLLDTMKTEELESEHFGSILFQIGKKLRYTGITCSLFLVRNRLFKHIIRIKKH